MVQNDNRVWLQIVVSIQLFWIALFILFRLWNDDGTSFLTGLCGGAAFSTLNVLLFLLINNRKRDSEATKSTHRSYFLATLMRMGLLVSVLSLIVFVIKVNPVGFLAGLSLMLAAFLMIIFYVARLLQHREEACSPLH